MNSSAPVSPGGLAAGEQWIEESGTRPGKLVTRCCSLVISTTLRCGRNLVVIPIRRAEPVFKALRWKQNHYSDRKSFRYDGHSVQHCLHLSVRGNHANGAVVGL